MRAAGRAKDKAVADLVPQGARLADVGTDHGYLPVRLLLDGKIQSAIASDLRAGPLSRASETARRYGIRDGLSLRLCPGLDGVTPGEVDCVSIAGMGGETIASILEAAPWTRSGTLLLLQPMTAFPDLRLFLQRSGYEIFRERIAREGRRLHHYGGGLCPRRQSHSGPDLHHPPASGGQPPIASGILSAGARWCGADGVWPAPGK